MSARISGTVLIEELVKFGDCFPVVVCIGQIAADYVQLRPLQGIVARVSSVHYSPEPMGADLEPFEGRSKFIADIRPNRKIVIVVFDIVGVQYTVAPLVDITYFRPVTHK